MATAFTNLLAILGTGAQGAYEGYQSGYKLGHATLASDFEMASKMDPETGNRYLAQKYPQLFMQETQVPRAQSGGATTSGATPSPDPLPQAPTSLSVEPRRAPAAQSFDVMFGAQTPTYGLDRHRVSDGNPARAYEMDLPNALNGPIVPNLYVPQLPAKPLGPQVQAPQGDLNAQMPRHFQTQGTFGPVGPQTGAPAAVPNYAQMTTDQGNGLALKSDRLTNPYPWSPMAPVIKDMQNSLLRQDVAAQQQAFSNPRMQGPQQQFGYVAPENPNPYGLDSNATRLLNQVLVPVSASPTVAGRQVLGGPSPSPVPQVVGDKLAQFRDFLAKSPQAPQQTYDTVRTPMTVFNHKYTSYGAGSLVMDERGNPAFYVPGVGKDGANGFTLSPDQYRYDNNGNLIAHAPANGKDGKPIILPKDSELRGNGGELLARNSGSPEGRMYTLKENERLVDATGKLVAQYGGSPQTYKLKKGEVVKDAQGNVIAENTGVAEPKEYKLNPGEVVKDANGKVIAENPKDGGTPKQYQLAPGQVVKDATGKVIAENPKGSAQQKAVIVPPGATVLDQNNKPVFTNPAAAGQPKVVMVGPNQSVYDATNNKLLFSNNAAQEKDIVLNPGQSVYSRQTNGVVFTNPAVDTSKPIIVGPNQKVVNGAGQVLFDNSNAESDKPILVPPGHTALDGKTHKPFFTAPTTPDTVEQYNDKTKRKKLVTKRPGQDLGPIPPNEKGNGVKYDQDDPTKDTYRVNPDGTRTLVRKGKPKPPGAGKDKSLTQNEVMNQATKAANDWVPEPKRWHDTVDASKIDPSIPPPEERAAKRSFGLRFFAGQIAKGQMPDYDAAERAWQARKGRSGGATTKGFTEKGKNGDRSSGKRVAPKGSNSKAVDDYAKKRGF